MTNEKNEKKYPPNFRLRDARLERGWSQKQLAAEVGTTHVVISHWEKGTHFPSPDSRERLCEVFNKTLAELGLIPPPSHSSRVLYMPIARNPFFTGRELLLELLHTRLSIARTAALTQAQALYGLGGIGKTQTAAEYAFRYGDEYTAVFWVRAAIRETLIADFVTLAELLRLPEKDEQDQRRIVAAVKRWLAAQEDWLLVMDNADDLPLAQEFLPANHKGYILFTTRAQASGAIAASVEVEKLGLEDGVLVLLRWAKLVEMDTPLDQVKAEDRATAERIVMEMDGLPLALAQAGTYIEETGCSLADYLTLYETHRRDLLGRHSDLSLEHDYPETVATTWSLSFQQVEQESPVAADLLRLCAFLAPDAIPEELLTQGATESGAIAGAETLDLLKLNEALKVLHRYSLVRRNRDTHMLSVHRLVQAVQRESMDQETQRVWAERTVRTVNAIFPEGDYYIDRNQQYYLPHVQECATLIKQYHLSFPEAAHLLYEAGTFLYFHGLYLQSQPLHQQALAIRQQLCRFDDPVIADSLNALAVLLRIQSDDEQAERFHLQALAIREKVLGPEHLATAESLNNLGVLYRNQRKYDQAESLLKRALNIRKQSKGIEHLDTLLTLSNLANLYLVQQQHEQAEQLLKQALAIGEQVLEPAHPLIAQNLNLLARLYYKQGNNEQAETLWKRALATIEESRGAEHPAIPERLYDLAECYVAQGRYTEAQTFCQKALNICEKLFGPEHPDTITVRKLLTAIMNKQEGETR